MRLIQPPPDMALLGLRAMKTIASASGTIGPSQRAVMEAARRMLLRIDADIDSLPEIDAASFAAGFPDPALRRQFVNGMLVMALADGVPDQATTAKVAEFAEAIGVDTPELTDLQRLTEHQMLLFRFDFLRRGHIADIMRNQLDQHGVLGLVKSVLVMRGMMADKPLAARFRSWADLPDGTLGQALARYWEDNKFTVPGEAGGFPEEGVYHDFAHVLGGYHTDPIGEIEVASFIAGFKASKPFYIVIFAILIFSTGVNVRPIDGDTTIGVLGEPGVAERMFAALERGGAVTTDLSDKWDYQPYVGLPLGEARRRLGVPT